MNNNKLKRKLFVKKKVFELKHQLGGVYSWFPTHIYYALFRCETRILFFLLIYDASDSGPWKQEICFKGLSLF